MDPLRYGSCPERITLRQDDCPWLPNRIPYPHLFTQILEVRDYSLVVNYEIQNIKFMQPVPVGGEIRLKAEIYEVKYIRDMTKVQFKVTVEIKGEKKPALQGKIVFLYQF